MSKINKESVLTISNSHLIAIARRDESNKVTLYTCEPVNMETLEKMLTHLTNKNEEPTNISE